MLSFNNNKFTLISTFCSVQTCDQEYGIVVIVSRARHKNRFIKCNFQLQRRFFVCERTLRLKVYKGVNTKGLIYWCKHNYNLKGVPVRSFNHVV